MTLRNVRGITERTLDFAGDDGPSGVTIVEGPNEAGKSTLAWAFEQLLNEKSGTTRAAVRSLQTEGSGEGPQVEVDMELGGQRFVYAKQFVKSHSTSLVLLDRAGEPTGQRYGGDEAHAMVKQWLAEHLDLDLWKSLSLRQGQGIDRPDLHGKRGLTSLLADLGDTTAIGGREADVLARVETEYARYFTEAAAKPTKELQAARQQAETAQQAFEDIDERYRQLERDISDVARIRSSIPELQQRATQASESLKVREQELELIVKLRSEVVTHQSQVEVARSRDDAVRQAAEARDELLDDLAALATRQEEEAVDLAAAVEAENTTAVEFQRATESLDAADEHLRAASSRRRLAADDRDHLRNVNDVGELRDVVDRARAADERAVDAVARRDAVRIDDAKLEQLRVADQQLRIASAALDAAVPEVTLTALQDVDVVVGDGEVSPVEQGSVERWSVDATLQITIGDVARLAVVPGGGIDDAQAARNQARQQRDALLSDLDQPDLAAVEAAADARRQADSQARQAIVERDAILNDRSLDDLEAELRRVEVALASYEQQRTSSIPLPADLAEAEAALRTATEEEHRAVEARDAALRQLDTVRTEHQGRVERRQRAEQTLATTRSDHDIKSKRLDHARASESDDALAERKTQAAQALVDASEALAAAQSALDARAPDTIEELATNARQVVVDAQAAVRDANDRLRELEVAVGLRGGEGIGERRAELQAERDRAQTVLRGVERRASAAAKLREVLLSHRADAQARYAAPLKDRIVTYGRTLYGPDFGIELGDTLAIARRRLDGLWLDFDQLSVGAQEQLGMLTRLACAALLADTGGVLMVDDALGHSDAQRLERLGAVFRQAGEHAQIIVLTCYPQRYAFIGGARRLELTKVAAGPR